MKVGGTSSPFTGCAQVEEEESATFLLGAHVFEKLATFLPGINMVERLATLFPGTTSWWS